jgi:hypothetical protein
MAFARMKAGESAKGFPSDQLPAQTLTIRYKGPFDFTYIYRLVQRWFEQRRFRFYETRIKDTGKKIKCDWEATRDIDEFYSEGYDIKVEMWNLTTQEIVVNGEPRKILNGMVQFSIKGTITADRLKLFSGSKLKTFLGKIIMDVRWREIENKAIDVMEYRTLDIQTMIKEGLNMTTKENAAW